MPKKNKSNVGNPYVTRAECQKTHGKIDLALWGADGRGGMVKDIAEIKAATSILKTVLLPIVLSVAASVITFLILGA